MNISPLRSWIRTNEGLAIAAIALALATSFYTIESQTRLSASLRSDPVYGTLKTPSETVHKAASKKRKTLNERIAERKLKAAAKAKRSSSSKSY